MFEREQPITHKIKFLRGLKDEEGVSISSIYYGAPFPAKDMIEVLELLFKLKANGPCPDCSGCAQDMDIIDKDIRAIKKRLKTSASRSPQ